MSESTTVILTPKKKTGKRVSDAAILEAVRKVNARYGKSLRYQAAVAEPAIPGSRSIFTHASKRPK